MEPHQLRVIEERSSLGEKLIKLQDFLQTPIFRKLSADEQVRLHRQVVAMREYRQVLDERIAAFTEKS